MTDTINDFGPETRALIKRLIDAGFKITSGHNGEYSFTLHADKPLHEFIEHLLACDEAKLFVTKGGVKTGLYLVFGNSPGELVCDYGVPEGKDEFNAALDAVVDAHYTAWDGKKQPTKVRGAL